ncbi:LysR family transcriptional regulator [Marinospirillum insulare]|uniref:Iron-regulated virulence regulatory protein IrgB n=1 Tax=Marinospirillum insulare TaxID=217169 RepID=A0ABQ5ZWQ2_9GAMM|nr:LysR family transcriptional regulator [Marinospirillum insulare]GLR63076.1 iron-regulated virulence regulatory protein IrgB [Marinospirillum insulare]
MEQSVEENKTLMSNYTTLQTLVFLRDEKSLTSTAKLMKVAKSTLSRRLAVLEEQLGYRLTQQIGGRLLLTPAGECYADYAVNILQTMEEAKQALGLLSQEVKGEISIQLCPELAMNWTIEALNLFLEKNTKVKLKINTFSAEHFLADNNPQDDLYISCKPLNLDQYKVQPLGQWRVAVYQAATWQEGVHLEALNDLKALNWIMPTTKQSIHLTHITTREKYQLKLEPRLQLDSFSMQAKAIADGYGVGVLPKWLAECPKNGSVGHFKEVKMPWKIEPITLILYYKNYTSPAIKALIEHLSTCLPRKWGFNR